MSFAMTVYFNDAGIDTTQIWSDVGVSYTKHYGDSNLYYTGYTGAMVFQATPADGYEFYRWVYRVGSASATVQYSYSNPFTYTAEQDIYIRAESTAGTVEPEPESWVLESFSSGEITAITRKYIYLEPYTLYRAAVQFAYDGEASFYTTGSFDTMGFLALSKGWDDAEGEPTDYEVFDDDSGEDYNFKITYEVEAGETYYIFFRGYDPETSGQLSFYIEPPSAEGVYGTGGFYIFNGTQWVKTIPYVWSSSGWVQMKPCLYTGSSWYEGI